MSNILHLFTNKLYKYFLQVRNFRENKFCIFTDRTVLKFLSFFSLKHITEKLKCFETRNLYKITHAKIDNIFLWQHVYDDLVVFQILEVSSDCLLTLVFVIQAEYKQSNIFEVKCSSKREWTEMNIKI